MKKLRKLRKDKGVTIDELAREIKMNKITLYRYEQEKRIPNAKVAIKIANYLGVKVEELM